MENKRFIVVDIGTSSMRCALIDAQAEQEWIKQIKYRPEYISDILVEQNPDDWKEACFSLLNDAADYLREKSLEAYSIALTSQRSSVIPVTREGRSLMNAIMWQDKRVLDICRDLEQDNERVIALSGAKINGVFAGPKMRWIAENKAEIYRAAHKLLTPADYVNFHLTGVFVTDHSYGSRTSLMNIRTRAWDAELLALFKVDEEKLCTLLPPGGVIGTLSAAAAGRCGLTEGLAVVSAGGDQQCSALGLGVFAPGDVEITAGTGGYVITAANRVPQALSRSTICGAAAIPGQYVLESTMLTCSSAFDYFIRLLYGHESEPYAVSQAEMDALSGSSTLTVEPFFQGRGTPSWELDRRAKIDGLSLSSSRAEILYGCLDGLAKEFALHLDLLSGLEGVSERSAGAELVVSGGLCASKTFLNCLAARTGRGLLHCAGYESTLYGAWLSAVCQAGVYASYQEAFARIKERFAFERCALV